MGEWQDNMMLGQLVYQRQQLARQTPQLGIGEPAVVTQGLVEQGDTLRVAIDRQRDAPRPVVQREHLR